MTKMSMSSQSDRNQTKRLRVGSDDTEIQCQKCDKIVKEKIECSGCKLDYCIYCANVTPQLFDLIQNGDLEDFMWTCRSCRATFPSLENISCVLKDIQKNTDQRIDSLESRMTNVEKNTEEAIKDSVENMKSEVIESLKENIDKLVDARSKEIEDRKRRESNLVLFNLPEHRTTSGDENKKETKQTL